MKLRSIVIGLLLALTAPLAAFAQCSGQSPASTYCGNPTGSLALPGWKPFSGIPFPSIAGGTVVGNRGAAAATASPLTNPILGIPGTSTGEMGFAGATGGTVTVKPAAAAGTYNFNLPTSAGMSGLPLLSGGGGATAQSYAILGMAAGGTNAALTPSNGGILYSTASAGAVLSGTATARQMLQSGTSAAPAWSTATWPATTAINQLLYSSSANAVVGLATANNGILVTNGSGVPSISTTGLPATALANPTSSIGLAAVNGSATTAMRSDGAPALSQTIIPTWSGLHTFTGGIANTGNPSIAYSPTGNETSGPLLDTYASTNIQATTARSGNREFLFSVGLTSNLGNAVANNNGDKVGIYSGVHGQAGSGNLWSFNTVAKAALGSGTYRLQGYELDVANYRADALATTSDPPVLPNDYVIGLNISGAVIPGTSFYGTIASMIAGGEWQYGHAIIGTDIQEAAFYEYTNPGSVYGIKLAGPHTYGVFVSSATAENIFNGPVGASMLGGSMISDAKLQVRTATNNNLVVRNSAGLANGIGLWSNDNANSTTRGMEFGANGFLFSGTGNYTITGAPRVDYYVGTSFARISFGTAFAQGNALISAQNFDGYNSASASTTFVQNTGVVTDNTSTSEDASFRIATRVAGTLANRIKVDAGISGFTTTGGDKGIDTANFTTYYGAGNAGVGATKTVRDSAGTGTCTLIFTGGILTGGTC